MTKIHSKARIAAVSVLIALTVIAAMLFAMLLPQSQRDLTLDADRSAQAARTAVNIANPYANVPSVEKPAGAPEDAVIVTADNFLDFLTGAASYGYLTGDLTLDWAVIDTSRDGGAANATYSLVNKTFNGNGHTVTLAPSVGGTISTVKNDCLANTRTMGLFVAENRGTIENVNFVYDTALQVNAKANYSNRAGLVCGTNLGTIRNVSLTVGNQFFYNQDRQGGNNTASNAWVVLLGGITGYNQNLIEDVYVRFTNYEDRKGILKGVSNGACKTGFTSGESVGARITVGGVVGRMQSDVESTNGLPSVTAVLQRAIVYFEAGTGIDASADGQKGTFGGAFTVYRELASVAGANSAYSGTETGGGRPNNGLGIMDNIISYTATTSNDDDIYLTNDPTDPKWGSNAVVHCGLVTNVTIFNDRRNSEDHNKGTNCNCANGSEHDAVVPNYVLTEGSADVEAKFVYNEATGQYDQQIVAKPQANHIIFNLTKAKIDARLTDALRNAAYTDQTQTYFSEDPVTETIAAQAASTENELLIVRAGQVGSIASSEQNRFAYTGVDRLKQLFVFTAADGTNIVPSDATYAKLKLYDGQNRQVTVNMPGEYSVRPDSGENENYALIDWENYVAFEVPTEPFVYTVDKTTLINTPTSSDVNGFHTLYSSELSIPDMAEGAIDGYRQTVFGQDADRSGTTFTASDNTPAVGRDYVLIGLKNGEPVTEPITINVKVDNLAPTFEIVSQEFAFGGEWLAYTPTVTVRVSDVGAGVNDQSVKMTVGGETIEPATAETDADGAMLFTFSIDKLGANSYTFIATDAMGNSESAFTGIAKIDTTAYDGSHIQAFKQDGTLYDPAVDTDQKTAVTVKLGGADNALNLPLNADSNAGYVLRYCTSEGESAGEDWIVDTQGLREFVLTGVDTITFRAELQPNAKILQDGVLQDQAPVSQTVTIYFAMPKVTVTRDHLTLSGSKTYNGQTDLGEIVINVSVIFNDGEQDVTLTGEHLAITARFADAHAAQAVALQDFTLEWTAAGEAAYGASVKLINGLNDEGEPLTYTIDKKQANVTVSDAQATYGTQPTLGAASGDVLAEDLDRVIEGLKLGVFDTEGNPIALSNRIDANTYAIKADAEALAAIADYDVTVVNDGVLTIGKMTVSRVVYDHSTIVGLFTDGTNKAGVKAQWIDAFGELHDLNVIGYNELDAQYNVVKAIDAQGDGTFLIIEKGRYQAVFEIEESFGNNYDLSDGFSTVNFTVAYRPYEVPDEEKGDQNTEQGGNGESSETPVEPVVPEDSNHIGGGGASETIVPAQSTDGNLLWIAIALSAFVLVAFAALTAIVIAANKKKRGTR